MKINYLNTSFYPFTFSFLWLLISSTSHAQTQQSTDCSNPTPISLCTDYEATIDSDQGNWIFNGTYLHETFIDVMGHVAIGIVEEPYSTSGQEHFFSFTPVISGSYFFGANPEGNPDPVQFETPSSPHYKAFYKPASSGCNANNWIEIDSYGDGIPPDFTSRILALQAGVPYLFMIDGEAVNPGESYTINFQLCKTDPPVCTTAPVANSCTNITANMPPGNGAWDFGSAFTGMNYTGSSTPGRELLYSYTPETTGYYIVTAISTNGKFDYLYKEANGSCDNIGWKEIATFDAPGTKVIPEQLSAGVTYYFLIDNQSLSFGNHTFQICKADDIDCNTATILNVCNATTIQIPTGVGSWDFAGNYPDNSVGTPSVGKEKFASFTPAVSANYSLEITNAEGGFINYLFKPASNECNQTGWTGIGKFNAPTGKFIGYLDQGVEYYFVLDNVDHAIASSQTFKICLTPAPNCLPAINIGLYNPVSATIPAGVGSWDNYPPDNLLASATPGKEIFFRFTPPATSKYSIDQTSGSPVKFYCKAETTECNNTGWKEMSLTGELQKGMPYLIVADQVSILSNPIQFEIIEAGEFLCPGASTMFCYDPFMGDYQGLVILSQTWYGSDNSTTYGPCLELLEVPASHYGYTYFSQIVARNSAYEFFEFNSPVYTLKFRSFWTGAISTDWNNPGNWSCNAVPDEYTDVIIPDTANDPEIQVNTSVKKLFVLPGASLKVKPNVILSIKD